MKKHFVKITSIENINPDIIKMVTTKPIGFKFIPGQNVGISIDKPHWNQIKRPFTFTSIPSDDYLEFMIKIFRKHDGETNEMMSLSVNDELILHEVFGNIKFSEEGVFIAGGMGVTPFISIMRQLHFSNIVGNNKLILANKTRHNILNEKEFYKYLGDNFINILSDEETKCYDYGNINLAYLLENCEVKNQTIYLCGPPEMMDSIEKELSNTNMMPRQIIRELF